MHKDVAETSNDFLLAISRTGLPGAKALSAGFDIDFALQILYCFVVYENPIIHITT
jgi:hypothetical protein